LHHLKAREPAAAAAISHAARLEAAAKPDTEASISAF
jgi:hypothetical protein